MSSKPSNADRVLLALHGCSEHTDRFEYPRRFSQRGMVERLGMAQSHISRAVSRLVSDGLIISERRRVAGERKRVTAYRLSEKGETVLEDRVEALLLTEVLLRDDFGELSRTTLGDASDSSEPLELANLLKSSDTHYGTPLIESIPGIGDAEMDLSTETITLLIEMANLKMENGDAASTCKHLRRAASLHRRRGDSLGEARCILLAAGLDGHLEEPVHIRSMVEKVGRERFSEDELQTLSIHLGEEHDSQSGDCNAIQQVVARGRELNSRLESESIDEAEVLQVIAELSLGLCTRPELVADIALKHGSETVLQKAWDLRPSMPILAHVGFSLHRINLNRAIIEELLVIFQNTRDAAGIDVCQRLLS